MAREQQEGSSRSQREGGLALVVLKATQASAVVTADPRDSLPTSMSETEVEKIMMDCNSEETWGLYVPQARSEIIRSKLWSR
jgi:hypothetical protein